MSTWGYSTPTGSNGLRRKQPQHDRPIILAAKHTGKRSAGNPHAPFDEAGAGNVTTAAGLRAMAKALEYPPEPNVGAPVLDPTIRRAQQGGIAERKAMIDRHHELPVKRQAELV